jgi:hypothetical protein
MIGSRAVVDDEAISTVLRLYIEGAANGDAGKLRAAFHEHARTYGSLNGTRYDISVPEMISMEERAPRNSERQVQRAHHVDRAGGRRRDGDDRGRRVLGNGVVHELPVARQDRRALADRRARLRARLGPAPLVSGNPSRGKRS